MIPYLDLKRQYANVGPDLEDAVLVALRSCSYALGDPVQRFEENFAAFCGTQHAVAVNSGTSALHLALLAAGVGPGDEVITVPSTFVATVAAIINAGATPVLVDVDPSTLNMDPASCLAAITPRTKAILPVHFHGRLANMTDIGEVARSHGLVLIEDAAQAHGAQRDGKRAGAFGHMGCFSFYPGKNLGAAGEGGAVTTDDPDLAAKIRSLRDWGQSERYIHAHQGFNFRMDAIQGAVLGVKLDWLGSWTQARQAVARAYDLGLAPDIRRPAIPDGAEHAYHVYAIRTSRRDALRKALTDAGIGTNIHYPRPVHLQPAYSGLGQGVGSFPVAEAYAAETLSLPIFPELRQTEIDSVVEEVNAFLAPQTGKQRKIGELVNDVTD